MKESSKDQDQEKKEKTKSKHLNEDGSFQGWKKTSLSIIKESGKSKNDRLYLKKKSLLKKLWKTY